MAYSVLGIYNLALSELGVSKIDSTSESSTAANRLNDVYQYVRDEVLEADDWDFATTRVLIAANAETPVYGYDYAYTLPADFLKLCEDKKDDPPVYPNTYPYVIEALDDGTHCLFCDYDNSDSNLSIKYVRREENPARYSASFVRALSARLAGAVALALTESLKKFEAMETLYDSRLRKAEGVGRSGNSITNETGSTDWIYAGR